MLREQSKYRSHCAGGICRGEELANARLVSVAQGKAYPDLIWSLLLRIEALGHEHRPERGDDGFHLASFIVHLPR
jgi:hypothetical protein